MSRRSSRRGTSIALLAVVVALVLIVILARPRQDPYLRNPLDPRGTGRDGLAATVELLRRYDAEVSLGGQPGERDDVVFQAVDRLSGTPQDVLQGWVKRGGTLVVTDPDADLASARVEADQVARATSEPAGCTLGVLSRIAKLGTPLPAILRPEAGDGYCFGIPGDGSGGIGAGVVVHPLGAGLVVTVSTVGPFLNEELGTGDNARFVVAVLGPAEGRRIRVLDPNRFQSDREVGDGTVLGALPDRGRQALLELGVAFAVWGLYRARRLGRPVPEELPVAVPSSELVLAVGEMLARGHDYAAVAERLRRRARGELGIALGLGTSPDDEMLIMALVQHVPIDVAQLHQTLVAPVASVADLLEVSHQLDRLREELHVVSAH